MALFYALSTRTGHPRSLSSSQHFLSFSVAELPPQIIMSMPESRKDFRLCGCGCNRLVSRWTKRLHEKKPPTRSRLIVQLESPPPPKRRRIAHFQAGQESSIVRPSKQKQSRTGNNSSTSDSRADASSSSRGNPQLHASSFEFDPSLPFLDQSPERTEAFRPSVDNVLLNLHAWTHRAIDQSDEEDSDDALERDAAEAADSVNHEAEDFWNGEDVSLEGDVDPREGIISDWDLLAEEFIVEAEELGKF